MRVTWLITKGNIDEKQAMKFEERLARFLKKNKAFIEGQVQRQVQYPKETHYSVLGG